MCFKRKKKAEQTTEPVAPPPPTIDEQQETQRLEANAAREAEQARLEQKRARQLEEEQKRRQTEEQIRRDQERAASRQAEMDRQVGGVEGSGMRSNAARRRRSLRGGRGRRSQLTSTAAGIGYCSRFL